MSDYEPRERLIELLSEMQGDSSLRALARRLKVNYASLSSYIMGEQFPEARNLEKIAIVKGWTRKELEAHLEGRSVEPTQSIDEILQNVRTLSPKDALRVARVALDVADSGV